MTTDGGKPGVDPAHLATLGRLTGGALHELANPLLALLGNAELGTGEAEPGTKLHQRLEVIEQTGLEIAEIVRALQGYIREQEAPSGRISLVDSAHAAVALIRRVSSVRDVELTVRADAEPVVRAQPGEILRSLIELVLDRLASADRGDVIELVVSERDGSAVVSLEGGRELLLDAVAR